MNRLYLVSLGAQEKLITKYCFGDCGHIIVGGVNLMGGAFLPCRTEKCPYLEKQLELEGTVKMFGQEEKIIVRKLRREFLE